MKPFLFFAILAFNISAHAFVTEIDGQTYSCDPTDRPRHSAYYCTIDSSFDGTFGGRGRTELEAKQTAMQACKAGSRSNGFFCDKNTYQCDSSN